MFVLDGLFINLQRAVLAQRAQQNMRDEEIRASKARPRTDALSQQEAQSIIDWNRCLINFHKSGFESFYRP